MTRVSHYSTDKSDDKKNQKLTSRTLNALQPYITLFRLRDEAIAGIQVVKVFLVF